MSNKPLVHVQMPKPDNDEAIKLLAELVEAMGYSDDKQPKAYYDAIEFLSKSNVLIEAHV